MKLNLSQIHLSLTDYSPEPTRTSKETSYMHGMLENNKYALEDPSYYGTSNFLKVPSTNISRSPQYPHSTKMELSPVGSIDGSSPVSQYRFSDKQKGENCKGNVILLQDLSHSYHGQNNCNVKEYSGSTSFKLNQKSVYNGFR